MKFQLDFILEQCPDTSIVDPEDLRADAETFTNHGAFDQNDAAVEEIQSLANKGWLKKFGTLDECTSFLGGTPVLSKLVRIEEEKRDASKREMKLKRRFIFDWKTT